MPVISCPQPPPAQRCPPCGGPFPQHAPASRQLLTRACIFRQVSPSASHSHRAASMHGSRPCTSPQTQLISLGNYLQQFFDNTPQIGSHPSPNSSSARTHHTSTLPPTATFSLQDPPPPTLQHFDSWAAQSVPTPPVHPFQDPDLKSPRLTKQLPMARHPLKPHSPNASHHCCPFADTLTPLLAQSRSPAPAQSGTFTYTSFHFPQAGCERVLPTN